MKKLLTIALAFLCMLGMVGCSQQPQQVQGNQLLAEGNVIKIDVSSLPEGYNYSFSGADAKAIVDYLSTLNLESNFEENPKEYTGMTWVISLKYENGDVLTIYHYGNMFIRVKGGSWYKMTNDEAICFDALLNELFSGCNKECEHNWERIGNYNESTAQDKCTKCGETRLYTDPDIMIPEQNTEDCPMQDTVPLIFSDYSDFLLFGSKGEIDISKYPNATIWLQNHEWNVDAFINFKELLDLPDETSKGLTEEIVIEKDNEYTYYVNSKDETNKLKTEYRITIKYDKNLSDKITYQESVAHINSVSDMTERTGSFVYRADSFDVLYYKTEVGYKSVTLVGHSFSIGVHFEGDGLTYPQIASAYGDVISNLFVEDVGVVNQTLYKLSDFILNK